MAEAVAEAAYESLEGFLDTLPRKPCMPRPRNRYYCTICERLNEGVAARCEFSKITAKPGQEKESTSKPLHFIQMEDDEGTSDTQSAKEDADASDERVEFKVVAPMKTDDDYPLIEFIRPKDKNIKPIEMELLEDVAIEFEISDDEPVEVEALEVVPFDETDEDLSDFDDTNQFESSDAVEVEVLEVEALDDESEGEEYIQDSGPALPEFKPITHRTNVPQPQAQSTTSGQTPKIATAPKPVSAPSAPQQKSPSFIPIKPPTLAGPNASPQPVKVPAKVPVTMTAQTPSIRPTDTGKIKLKKKSIKKLKKKSTT